MNISLFVSNSIALNRLSENVLWFPTRLSPVSALKYEEGCFVNCSYLQRVVQPF